MKKILMMLCAAMMVSAASAQLFKPKYKKPQESYTTDANGNIVKKSETTEKRGLFDRNKKAKEAINPKYLAGACPTVNGKVEWSKDIAAHGMSAKAIYEKLLPFMQRLTKEEGQTKLSNVALVNDEDYEIGARYQEVMVFHKKPLSLDQTYFNYQLIVRCFDGKFNLTMRNMSYIYEEERGGGQFPAEDMLLDEEALNKEKTGFHIGGYKKFRTKTIDRKDELFNKFAEAVK